MGCDVQVLRWGPQSVDVGFAADLEAFDPTLAARWNVAEQVWEVCQRVRRRRVVGHVAGNPWVEVFEEWFPVLQLVGWPARTPLDRRVLEALYEQRAPTQKEWDRRSIDRMRAASRKRKAEAAADREWTNEVFENAWHDPAFRRNVGMSPRISLGGRGPSA